MVKSYREDCNDAKAARQGINEQRPVSGKSKRERPIVVQCRMNKAMIKDLMFVWCDDQRWRKWGSYRSEAEAQKAIDNHRRKGGMWELRVQPAKEE